MAEAPSPRRGLFDLWSRFYDLPAVQRAIYHPVHEAVLDELRWPPIRRVLDVGCGTGILTSRYRTELGADLVAGCDFSAGMLEQAAQRRRDVGWVQGDAVRLPVRTGSVDAVTSTESFHWFPDQEAAIAEFFRVLVPGGRFIVGMVNVRARAVGRAGHAWSRALGNPAQWPTRRELRNKLEAAGFAIPRQRRVSRVGGVVIPTVLTVAVKP